MVLRARNRGAVPYLHNEGILLKPLPVPEGLAVTGAWSYNMSPHERMHNHQTLASVRRYAHFHPYPGLIPKDALELTLMATYDHGHDHFPEKSDTILQEETLGIDTWRRMRNTRDIKKEKDAISAAAANVYGLFDQSIAGGGRPGGSVGYGRGGKLSVLPIAAELVRYNELHDVYIGGVRERRHPCNIRLMNSGHHSPQTNAGYSRQDSDGNSYQY